MLVIRVYLKIFFDYLVYVMPIVYTSGHYLYSEQLFPYILQSVGDFSLLRSKIEQIFSLDPDQDYLTVLNQAQEMLRRKHSIARMTIQVEPYDAPMMSSCETCRRPAL